MAQNIHRLRNRLNNFSGFEQKNNNWFPMKMNETMIWQMIWWNKWLIQWIDKKSTDLGIVWTLEPINHIYNYVSICHLNDCYLVVDSKQ